MPTPTAPPQPTPTPSPTPTPTPTPTATPKPTPITMSISYSIDQFFEDTAIGSIKKAIGNSLYGINFRQTPTMVPMNKDSHGFTFFTRPQLNLDLYNIVNHRGFYNLINKNSASYQRYVRLMLDPRLCNLGAFGTSAQAAEPGLISPFVDPYTAFIPLLTNNITSISGWPDLTVPVHTSQAGLYGEEHSFVDGVANNYEAHDIDATFKNMRGNPLIYLFYTWIKYETLVFEGILDPYLDFIIENEIDYNTRIYRIVLNQDKRYVTAAACTGASFPINIPSGAIFDFNIDKPYNMQNSEINIRFRSMGFTAFEDIVKYEFNSAVGIFHPSMRALLANDTAAATSTSLDKLRENPKLVYSFANMSKIPYALTSSTGNTPYFTLNNRAYPWINLATGEMEWWVQSNYLPTIRTYL